MQRKRNLFRGCNDKEFIEEVEKCCERCRFCQKYRRQKQLPVVSFPKADRFNQVVAMDLKEVTKGKLWILHLVVCATRYLGLNIEQNGDEIFVDQHSYVKELKEINIDQKRKSQLDEKDSLKAEQSSKKGASYFRFCGMKLGIETSTTPGENPFSNGIVERGNTMLYETMMKTKEDAMCSLERALAWAVSAKNALQNTYGYSPNQLVFGSNVNLLSRLLLLMIFQH